MKKILFYLFFMLIPLGAISQNFTTWTGSGNWSNAANWSSGTGYGQLQFTNSGSAAVTADASMSQWRLFFNNGVSYTISGSGALSLFDNAGNPSWVLSDASVNQNLNFPLFFADSGARYAWMTTRAAGPLTFGGNVSVTGGSILALRLAGSNTAGAITLNGTFTSSRPLDIGKDNADVTQSNTRVFLNGINSGFSGVTTIYGGTLTVPANSALGSNTVTLGNGTVTTTLAITGDTARSQGIIVADGSSAGVIDVAATKNFEMAGVISQTGSNQGTKVGKSGAGNLTLTGSATYQGQFQIGNGSIIVNNNNGLGLNTSTSNRGLDLGLNVGDVSEANNVSLLANNGITVGQSIFVASNASGATRTIGLNGAGSATFGNEIFLGGEMTANGGSGTVTFSGPIVNTSGVKVTAGTVVFSGNNTYIGATTISGGTLRLGADNRIANASAVVLSGGTFSTGATTGFSDVLGTLNLTASSTIALGTGNHTLTFANSSGFSPWTGTSLSITGWLGIKGQTNSSGGKIMVGVGGLTSAQLTKISFAGYVGTPIILASGELVPPGPALAVTAGSLTHNATCVGTAASTVTYTITNTGGNAAGLTVSSNNPEFVVSNAATTVSGAGGTATYQVTFTPSAGGSRSAAITISTTTPNSNAPVTSSLIGIGNALPTASISGTTAVCQNAAAPTITFTGGAGTAPYTFTYQINGAGSFTATTVAGNSVAVTVLTGTAGSYAYSLVSVQDSSSTACSNAQSGSATITVNALPTATILGTLAVCQNAAAPTITFTGASGSSPYTFAYQINGSGSFTATTVAGNSVAVTVPTGTAGSYAYSLVSVQDSSSTTCSNAQSGSATITVNPLPTAAIIGTTTVCRNSTAPSVTFTGAAGTSPYTFTYQINGSGSFTATTAVGNSIAVSVLTGTAGSYAYSLVSVQDSSSTMCSNAQTGTATVTVDNGTTYYADTDSDGFGDSAVSQISCTGQPANTVLNNTDCAPSDSTKWRTANLYVDADNDGFYNGGVTSSVCYGASIPSGYVAVNNGTDCNDNNAEINPNHVEVLANGIDDNCDGTVDETDSQTGLISSQCGFTMSNISTTLFAGYPVVVGAMGYRFEVTNGSNVRTYDSATSGFSLLSLPGGVLYGTTYMIRVSVMTAPGFYRAYSTICSVTTPAVPATTNLVTSQCGITLSSMSTSLFANQVTAASQYRFEVSDGITTRTYDTPLNRFSFTNLAGINAYGTTYTVRVALMIGGVWQDYGASCNVTTAATPTVTSVSFPSCGSTITNSWQTIFVTPVADAEGYRFEVSWNGGTSVRYYSSAVPRFSLRSLSTFTTATNTAYTIRVAILFGSVYQAFGPSCIINTGSTVTRQTATAVNVFEVKAYPNPFAGAFRLDMNTSSEEIVGVKVYDMLGKLMEARELSAAEFGSQEIGDRYSSGVYNVIVTQGENVKTLRVIKR